MVDFADLIGAPFAYGARGPDAFDCYGLVLELARRDGKTLPDFGNGANWMLPGKQNRVAAMMGASMPQWRQTPSQPGAVVLIRIGRFVSHVAYQIDPHRMLHAWQQSNGVSVVKIDEWRHRIVGFYEYVGS